MVMNKDGYLIDGEEYDFTNEYHICKGHGTDPYFQLQMGIDFYTNGSYYEAKIWLGEAFKNGQIDATPFLRKLDKEKR